MSKEVLRFDQFEVVLEAENLRFNEHTLSKYIEHEGGYYDNFGKFLSLAERNLQNKENLLEKVYNDRFVEAKEVEGGSDKLAEAKAKADQTVMSLKNDITEAKYIVSRLRNHLKAWDKNHDNAQSLGHMLRKQMDQLRSDIYGSHGYQPSTDLSPSYGTEMHNLSNKVESQKQVGPPKFSDDLGLSGLIKGM